MQYVEVRSRELSSVFDYMAQDVAVATDGAGQKLTDVHFEDEPGRQSAAKLLTRNEARRIATAMLSAGIETDSRSLLRYLAHSIHSSRLLTRRARFVVTGRPGHHWPNAGRVDGGDQHLPTSGFGARLDRHPERLETVTLPRNCHDTCGTRG
jgi:hypothetical protein